jgi:hypothetical protein
LVSPVMVILILFFFNRILAVHIQRKNISPEPINA